MSWLRSKLNWWLLLALSGVFLLRLPTFFEPYWDGDEGVYYILGQVIARGGVLYRDIWDNKTPLLYLIYAFHPELWWAKLTALVCVLGTSVTAYFLAKRLKINGALVAFLTGAFLSMPALAGNTANAELYFTLPIAVGAYLALTRGPSVRLAVTLGLLAAAAFNLKVPAVFDFAGIFLAYTIIHWRWSIWYWLKFYVPVTLAFATPLLGFIAYFYFNHALSDFLIAAFTQNSTYVSVYSGPLGKLASPLVLHGVVLLVSLVILFIFLKKKWVSQELFFLAAWLGSSIYAVLLSGRPYSHYLLQIAAPVVLLATYLITNRRRFWLFLVVFLTGAFFLARMFWGGDVNNLWAYYLNFWGYVTETKTWDQYQLFFGQDNVDAYQMAAFLKDHTKYSEPVFVWGENDYMYILPPRPPATKFIRAHHLTTVDKKNFDLIMDRLHQYLPKYILIMRPVSVTFPRLEVFVANNYRLVTIIGNYYVYQNASPVSPPLFNLRY